MPRKRSRVIRQYTAHGRRIIPTPNTGRISTAVSTDRETALRLADVSSGGLDFSSMDLELLSLSPSGIHTVTVHDPTKDFLEKEITVYSSAFRSPIGIQSINYRYRIKGNHK